MKKYIRNLPLLLANMAVAPSHAQLIATGLEMNSEGAILALENEAGEQVKAIPVDEQVYEFITTHL